MTFHRWKKKYGALETASPRSFSFTGVENAGHSDPLALANFMELDTHIDTLDAYSVHSADAFEIGVAGLDAAGALISVDWGDGTAFDAQANQFSHRYEAPGAYLVSVLVVDQGAVQRYSLISIVSEEEET